MDHGIKESLHGFQTCSFWSIVSHLTCYWALLSLIERIDWKCMLFLYTDGGPDHCLTFPSVQPAQIALILNPNLDILISGRTAPHHSWYHPVERMMSIMNLGLQCISIMWTEGKDEFKQGIKNANNLQQLQEYADHFKEKYNKIHCSSQRAVKQYNVTSGVERRRVWGISECHRASSWRLLGGGFVSGRLSPRDWHHQSCTERQEEI